jgi:ABC-2 type transport system ATP-binding protein
VTHAVRLRGLTRVFGGVRAVDAVDLDVLPGEGFAIVGAAGAGRTTLLRLVATLLRPSAGEFWISGVDAIADSRAARAHVLYVHPDAIRGLGLTVAEYLRVVARSPRASRGDVTRSLDEVLQRTTLRADADVDRLSRGARCRLVMAASLLLGPSVALFDDVLDRLEPDACRCVGECITALRHSGSAVLSAVTTAADAAFVADVAIVMDRGRLSQPTAVRSASGLLRPGTDTAPRLEVSL